MCRETQIFIEENSMPEPNSGCWLWLKSLTGNGYPSAYMNGRNEKGHRVSWVAFNKKPIPTGYYICHKCDNRACVNPDHLFLGTPQENNDDMMRKNRFVAPGTKGSRHGRAKITEETVVEILRSPESGRVLAEKFGVSTNIISRIRLRKIWKHVEIPNRADTSL